MRSLASFKSFAVRFAAAVTALMMCAAPSMAQTPVPISFRLDWTIYGTHAPFFYALEKGLYAKEGLDVKIGVGDGSANVAQQVAQDHDQMGFIDFGSMIRGVAQGMPLIAVMRVLSNNMVIVSHAASPIKTPKGLEGKVIAFSPGESTAQMFPALLAANGIDGRKISVVSPAVGAKLALFLENRVDAITASLNVQVPQIEAQGAKLHYFRYSDFGVPMMNNGIVANSGFVAKHPNAVRKFLKVTREAFLDAMQHPNAAVDALIRERPQQARNRAVLLRQLQLSTGLYVTAHTQGKPFGEMSKADWEKMDELLVKYGGLPKAVPVGKLYTNAYLPK